MTQPDETPIETTPGAPRPSEPAVPASPKRRSLPSLSRLFSDNSLTKKASLNALASILDYGARLLVGFLVTPLMVAGLGDFYYGVWQILTRLVGYINPASGRPTQALKMTLANQQASTDYELKRRYVGSALAVLGIFTPLMVILGAILVWYAPAWIKVPPEYTGTVRITAGMLVMNLILFNFFLVQGSVVEGENLGYKRMGLSIFLVFLGGGLTWLALYLKTGIIGIAAAYILHSVSWGIFAYMMVRSFVPWYGISRPTRETIGKFLDLSWWFVAWNLIMSLMLAADVVVLGIVQSAEAVTSYSLTKYAPETLISIIAIVAFGIAPGLGRIIGSGDFGKASKLRNEIMAFTWLIVTVLGACVLMWNRTFLTVWVGGQRYAGAIPNLFIVLVVTQFVFIRNDGNVIDLTLNLRRKVLLGGLSVFTSLVAAVALLSYSGLGIVGLSLGLILGRALMSIGYPMLIGRFMNISFSAQVKGALRPILVTGLLFAVTAFLGDWIATSHWHGLTGWIYFALSAAATFPVILALAFFTGLAAEQRKQIMRRVRTALSMSA